MSDLQCPATLLVACHTEEECDGVRGLTDRGRGRARALAEGLRDRRVAMVFTSPVPCAVQTAEIAAAVLAVGIRVHDALGEAPDHAGGEDDTVRAELEALADLFRGECVLVVGHGGVVPATVAQMARNLPARAARERSSEDGDVVEVAVDADGWWVRGGAGKRPDGGSAPAPPGPG